MWKKFAQRSRERTQGKEEDLAKAIGRDAQIRVSKFIQDFQANSTANAISAPSFYTANENKYLQLVCKRLHLKSKFVGPYRTELLIRKASAFNQIAIAPKCSKEIDAYFASQSITREELGFVWGELKAAPGLARGLPKALTHETTTTATHSTKQFLKPPPPVMESRKLLPTWSHREEILEKISQSEVTIIQGATGSGKSTQVVQYLLDQANPQTKVLCTQPRRLAAMALATRVAKERYENQPGNSVGYAVRFDSQHSDNTQLLFCTTGITLMSLRDGLKPGGIFDGVTHLVIDEVHERDRNADFLLIFVRELLLAQRNKDFTGQKIKLVLMSATMKVNSFEKYFDGLTCSNVEVEGRTFPVDAYFSDDLATGVGSKSAVVSSSAEPEVDHQLIVKLLDDITQNKYAPTHTPGADADTSANACLVFLPGWGDIQDLSKALAQHPKFRDRTKFRILPLHSGIPPRDQMMVFARPPPGVMKIILSTNIAETSLTVEDVAYVIDTGLAKEKGYDATLKSSSLLPTFVSQANAMQRRGRAGRCRPGVCFHLYSKQKFESMPKFQVPELLRTPLDELCLNARSILANNTSFFSGVSVETFLGKALDAPPQQSIKASLQTLMAIGALDPQEQLTGLGKRLCALPVEPKLGKTVLYGSMLSALDPAITLSVASGFRDPFMFAVNDAEKRKLSQAKKQMSSSIAQLGSSDHASVLKAYDGYVSPTLPRNQRFTYCNTNFLSSNVMDSLVSMHRQVLEKLPVAFKSSDAQHNSNKMESAVVSALVCTATFPNLALCKGKKLLCDPGHRKIKPHASSSVELFRRHRSMDDAFYVFEELVRGVNGCDLRVMTQVDAVALALFASSMNLFQSNDKDGFRLMKHTTSDFAQIGLNSWFSIVMDKTKAEQLAVLRLRFETAFLNAMNRGSYSKEDRALADTVLRVLALQLDEMSTATGDVQQQDDEDEEEEEDDK